MALTYLRFLLPVVRSGEGLQKKNELTLLWCREGVQKIEEKLDDNSQRGSRSMESPWFRIQYSRKVFPVLRRSTGKTASG